MNWSFVSDQVKVVYSLRVFAPGLSMNELIALGKRIHVKIVDAQLVVGIDGQFEESTPVVVVEVEVNMEAKRHDDTSYGGQHLEAAYANYVQSKPEISRPLGTMSNADTIHCNSQGSSSSALCYTYQTISILSRKKYSVVLSLRCENM
ncbi:unnamed protein product [Peronospora effusa]|nr:unnamed protein product [Peronospora effusa]